MAIDSRAKRASVASLALAFIGPSVQPDSSITVFDRQTIAGSYYGIDSTTQGIDAGGDLQLGNFDLTGTATLEINAGGDLQLAAFDLEGGATLEINAGGNLQLGGYELEGSATTQDNPKYVEITLVSKTGTLQSSLTSLSWAWFDTDDIGSAIAPSDQGTTETTDGSAVINIEIPNTTLAAAQDGILVVQSDDKTKLGAYVLTVQQ